MRARRTTNRVLSVVLALALPAIALVPIAAAGEPQKKPATKAAPNGEKSGDKNEKYDPDNITAISQYIETIAKGTERWVAKDYTTAIDTFKKAIQLSPKNPLGHYLLAEAYLGSGNPAEAEAALQQALETNDPKNASLRARILFLQADLLEREKKWDQAKTAWQAYAEAAAKLGDAGAFPQTPAERIKAIQRVVEMEKVYVGVRERIAAEKADAGKTGAKKP